MLLQAFPGPAPEPDRDWRRQLPAGESLTLSPRLADRQPAAMVTGKDPLAMIEEPTTAGGDRPPRSST